MNFQNKFHIYDRYADIQKEVAEHLLNFIKENMKDSKIDSIFEIGCGTGIFTKCFLNQYSPTTIILNDYFDTRQYFKDIEYTDFYCGNIENINIPNSDIVVSSSALQWIDNLEKLISRVAEHSKIFSFSIFTFGNLYEIKDHFGISLNYHEIEEIYALLKKYFPKVNYTGGTYKKQFETPLEVLRHLKNTGVTGFKKTTIGKIRSFNESTLTYKVGYFYCSK